MPLDPGAIKWRHQANDFAVAVPTLLDDPTEVFLKRWSGERAPAHDLWMRVFTEKCELPSAAQPLGYATDRQGSHFYASENLGAPWRLLEEVMKAPKGMAKDPEQLRRRLQSVLIDNDFGGRTAKAAASLFERLNRLGFVYSDFTHKNVMVNADAGQCRLIDLDSCFPSAKLPSDAAGLSGLSNLGSIVYWYAWLNWAKVKTPATLSRFMVLSWAAVWARAIGMLRSGDEPAAIAQFLRGPKPQEQEILWRSLQRGEKKGFQQFFGLTTGAALDDLWDQWRGVYGQLQTEQANVSWREILAHCDTLFSKLRTEKVSRISIGIVQPRPGPVPPRPTVNELVQRVKDFWFSAAGTISQGRFVGAAAGGAALMVAILIITIWLQVFQLLWMEQAPVTSLMALNIRRAHDRGKSGRLEAISVSGLMIGNVVMLLAINMNDAVALGGAIVTLLFLLSSTVITLINALRR